MVNKITVSGWHTIQHESLNILICWNSDVYFLLISTKITNTHPNHSIYLQIAFLNKSVLRASHQNLKLPWIILCKLSEFLCLAISKEGNLGQNVERVGGCSPSSGCLRYKCSSGVSIRPGWRTSSHKDDKEKSLCHFNSPPQRKDKIFSIHCWEYFMLFGKYYFTFFSIIIREIYSFYLPCCDLMNVDESTSRKMAPMTFIFI